MPALIPAAVGAFAASAAVAGGASAFAAGLLAAGAAFVSSLVVSGFTAPRGRQQQLPTFQAEARDRQLIVRSSVETRRIVYGEVAVSGPLVYAETTGDNRQYLHLVIPLAGHEVEAIDAVYFDDEMLPLDSNGFAGGRWTTDQTLPESVTQAPPAPGVALNLPSLVAIESVVLNYNGQTYTINPSILAHPDLVGQFEEGPNSGAFAWWLVGEDLYVTQQVHVYSQLGGTITVKYFTTVTNSFVRIKKHLGADDQAADSDLVSESGGQWTSEHRLRGIAYLYARLEFDDRVFPTGIPNIKASVRGKKLYDPRGGSPTLVRWSQNWALVVRDYLAGEHGLACSDAEIDDELVMAAANVCDESVRIDTGSPEEVAVQSRYLANGTINLADRPVDILRQIMTAAAGAAVFTEGVWKLFAGAYVTPTVDIDEDWLRGPVRVRAKAPRRELFNGVRGTYTNPEKFWQPTDFPPVTNSTYETQDGGEQILRDIELPFTSDTRMAQRLAKIHLEEARQGIVVELPCNLKAFQVSVWDNVRLSLDIFGWEDKVFRVLSWTFNPEQGGVDLVLQETASTVYDWNAGEATVVDPAPDTALLNPFGTVAAPSNLQASHTQDSNRVLVSWTASADAFVNLYQVEYKRAADSEYTVVPRLNGTSVDLGNLLPGDYNIRVKGITVTGAQSSYTTLDHTITNSELINTYPILSSILVNTWTEQSSPKSIDLFEVIAVGTRFLAVGREEPGSPSGGAFIITSDDDGVTWTQRNNPKARALSAAAVGELPGSPTVTRIVAVGQNDGSTDAYIITSDDGGETWTERANPKNLFLHDVTWSPELGLFCAVGSADPGSPSGDAYIITSPDGVTWTERANPSGKRLDGIAWSPELGIFCAVGDTEHSVAYIVTSSDGINWNEQTPPKDDSLNAVLWVPDDGLFMAFGEADATDGYIVTSPDGETWTERANPQAIGLLGAAEWNGSITVAVGAQGYIISSSDGILWTQRTCPKSVTLSSVAWNGRVFVIVGLAESGDSFICRSLPIS